MNDSVNGFMVYHPMHPIEVGVVQKNNQYNTEYQVRPAVFIYVKIDLRVLGKWCEKYSKPNTGKNE